ncbi:hypothetical protein AVEN_128101-1 [Araneus ventricosus]|uniref:Uncharacterized protein n=1 Tax=Araneus ventricosus TaxID=182803 RepID=A0A4Y1ZZI8_ARAVE|nr:hypothetical protein AVEN_128101-1 [Araneus ventricosus]
MIEVFCWSPRWPCGKFSDSVPANSRFETRMLRRSAVYVDQMHAKSNIGHQMSSRWCGAEALKGGCQSRFKFTISVTKYPSCCFKTGR